MDAQTIKNLPLAHRPQRMVSCRQVMTIMSEATGPNNDGRFADLAEREKLMRAVQSLRTPRRAQGDKRPSPYPIQA